MALRPVIPLTQYRGHVITAQPAIEPVSVQEVQAAIAVHGDDDFIASLITEARQEIEEMTGLALITQSWRLSLDRWPGAREDWWDGVRQAAISEIYATGVPAWVQLPRYPLQAIDAVTVFDEASNSQTVTVGDVFDIDTYQKPGRMALRRGQTWPIALRTVNAIQIDYTAGYGAALDVPAPLKRAIRAMAAYMYEHRGDGCTGADAYAASGAAAIVGRYKVTGV
jgi:uncharacterized phiE125 gp8 family phage protein